MAVQTRFRLLYSWPVLILLAASALVLVTLLSNSSSSAEERADGEPQAQPTARPSKLECEGMRQAAQFEHWTSVRTDGKDLTIQAAVDGFAAVIAKDPAIDGIRDRLTRDPREVGDQTFDNVRQLSLLYTDAEGTPLLLASLTASDDGWLLERWEQCTR